MLSSIEELLVRYERGLITRRQVVGALALIAFPGSAAAARRTPQPPAGSSHTRQSGVLRGINLNHVNLRVADLDRSVAFYRGLFSLPPAREVPGRPWTLDLADGTSFLSLPEGQPGGVIDHYCVGVEDFEPQRVGDALRAAGFESGLQVGPDFVYVTDPDGIRVQISTPEWNG
jgi:catechol 2,3-dioxygenase-like lactoylglutathione lyase family enzyme